MAIIHVNLCQPAPPVENWTILLMQSLTAHMPLLTVTIAFGLGKRQKTLEFSSTVLSTLYQYHREVPLFSKIPEFSFNTVLDR